MEKRQFQCSKCGYHKYEAGKFHASGGTLAKLFDVQNKKFVTISCANCGYTEIYKGDTSTGMNVLDFLMN